MYRYEDIWWPALANFHQFFMHERSRNLQNRSALFHSLHDRTQRYSIEVACFMTIFFNPLLMFLISYSVLSINIGTHIFNNYFNFNDFVFLVFVFFQRSGCSIGFVRNSDFQNFPHIVCRHFVDPNNRQNIPKIIINVVFVLLFWLHRWNSFLSPKATDFNSKKIHTFGMEASELRCQDVIVESKKGWASKIEVQSRRKDCKNVVMYVCVCVCSAWTAYVWISCRCCAVFCPMYFRVAGIV